MMDLKKIIGGILAGVCLLTTMLSAVDDDTIVYDTVGYYQANIYLQNKLTKYQDEFGDAVSSWNSAGITGRSVVVNTVASNKIENFNFGENEDFWYDQLTRTYGLYRPISSSSSCSCHTTSIFYIFINEGMVEEKVYSNPQINTNIIQGTICHELGHAFGLAEYEKNVNYLSSIMNVAEENVHYIATPQAIDIANANACWAQHDS